MHEDPKTSRKMKLLLATAILFSGLFEIIANFLPREDQRHEKK